MTIKEYIDEVKIRLKRYDVSERLDDALLATYVNDARRDVQQMLMPLYPERYGNIAEIDIPDDTVGGAYVVPMPIDLIEAKVVQLSYTYDGNDYQYEARGVTKFELKSVQTHAWNLPLPMEPTYTIEVDSSTIDDRDSSVYIMYLDPGIDLFQTGYSNQKLKVYYVAEIDALEYNYAGGAADDDVTTPSEHEELVIYQAMLLALGNVQDNRIYYNAQTEVIGLMNVIRQDYEFEKAQEIDIPSKEGEE